MPRLIAFYGRWVYPAIVLFGLAGNLGEPLLLYPLYTAAGLLERLVRFGSYIMTIVVIVLFWRGAGPLARGEEIGRRRFSFALILDLVTIVVVVVGFYSIALMAGAKYAFVPGPGWGIYDILSLLFFYGALGFDIVALIWLRLNRAAFV